MELVFRQALEIDLPILIQMLADDQLGTDREDASIPINKAYLSAFKVINDDQNNELIVVESGESIIGMLQLTFIPYLTYKGSWRCLVEGVRVHKDYRGHGHGTQLFKWAIQRARQQKCKMIQLTSNKQRTQAIKFYESLGFKASHEGFKMSLFY